MYYFYKSSADISDCQRATLNKLVMATCYQLRQLTVTNGSQKQTVKIINIYGYSYCCTLISVIRKEQIEQLKNINNLTSNC